MNMFFNFLWNATSFNFKLIYNFLIKAFLINLCSKVIATSLLNQKVKK